MLTGTAQALSPLKKFEPDGVPVAERSTLPTVTEPVALVFVVLKLTNVPFELVKLVTPLDGIACQEAVVPVSYTHLTLPTKA